MLSTSYIYISLLPNLIATKFLHSTTENANENPLKMSTITNYAEQMILKHCNKYSFIQQKQIATRKSKMAKKYTRLAEKVALNFKNWKNEKWSKRIRMHIASSGLSASSDNRYEKSAATRTKKMAKP